MKNQETHTVHFKWLPSKKKKKEKQKTKTKQKKADELDAED